MQISFNCPHCGTEKAGFSGRELINRKPNSSEYLCMMQCLVCGDAVVTHWIGVRVGLVFQGQDQIGPECRLVRTYPSTINAETPEGLPENVKRFYTQGINAQRRKDFDAAGTMFRKSLDVGIKILHPDGKGMLAQRIKELPERIGVTEAMRQWANEIRELGNDAAHESEPFTEQEANELQKFTELFLIYAFALPSMVAAREIRALLS